MTLATRLGARVRHSNRHGAGTRIIKVFLCLTCAVLALAGCASDAWRPIDVGTDLLADESWVCYPDIDRRDGALTIHAYDTFRSVTNTYGPHIIVDGDFAVVAEVAAAEPQLVAVSLVGRPGTSDWWDDTQRLDVGLVDGDVVVNYYDGTGFMPRLSETFPADLGLEAELEVRREGEVFTVLADGREVGELIDPGLFPDGVAYVGASLQPGNTLTIKELTVKVPSKEESVAVQRSGDEANLRLSDPPLRALAEAVGLHVGAAVAATPLRCDSAYRTLLAHEFNMVATENAMKFGPIHPEPERYDFAAADAIVDFAEAHDMAVRGHTLVWHNQQPAWIETAEFTEEGWEAVLQNHIATVMDRYRGRVDVWDVVNEAIGEGGPDHLRSTVWLEGLGPDYIDKAFRWAHEADPDALLFYNDYGAEGMNAKSQHVYDLVKGMVERGVPIDGVGLQMHVAVHDAPDPDAVLENMERLAELGLQIHITELDVRVPQDASDEIYARQTEIYQQLMGVCTQASNCTAFVMWGLTDRYSWIPNHFPGTGEALVFDRDYRPKPAYEALRLMLIKATQSDAAPFAAPDAQSPDDVGTDCSGCIAP